MELTATYRYHQWELGRNVASATNLLEGFMKRLKLGMLQLVVVEPKEVVHDDIARQCWECMGQVHRLLPRLELLHPGGEGINVSIDNMNKVQDRTP
jgi:hypothetical protein